MTNTNVAALRSYFESTEKTATALKSLIALITVFTLAACGSGGGSGGMEMMPAPTQPVMLPETSVPTPGPELSAPAPSPSSSTSSLVSPGREFQPHYLDYNLFGSWAIDRLGDTADVTESLVGDVQLRFQVGPYDLGTGKPTTSFKLRRQDIVNQDGYIFEGPVIGIHYARGNRRLEGTIRMEFAANDPAQFGDDRLWVSFSDNLPLIAGRIPILEDLPFSSRHSTGGDRGMIEGEHNGQIRTEWVQSNRFSGVIHLNDGTPEVFARTGLNGFIQNKRFIDGQIVTGDHYAIGEVWHTDSTRKTLDDLAFYGIFAAPGQAP